MASPRFARRGRSNAGRPSGRPTDRRGAASLFLARGTPPPPRRPDRCSGSARNRKGGRRFRESTAPACRKWGRQLRGELDSAPRVHRNPAYRLQKVRLKNSGMPVLARRFVFMFPPGYLSSYPLYWRCSCSLCCLIAPAVAAILQVAEEFGYWLDSADKQMVTSARAGNI